MDQKGNFHTEMVCYLKFTRIQALFLELFRVAVYIAVGGRVVESKVPIKFSIFVVFFVHQFTGSAISCKESVSFSFFEKTCQKFQFVVLPKSERSVFFSLSETNFKVWLAVGVLV